MRITQLQVDGFGVWSDLRLDDWSDRANLVFGPNESGKTTLLQFVRSVLYGFSADRRGRYLPPVAGGAAGGALVAIEQDQRFEISRLDSPDADPTQGRLRMTAPDGTLADDRQLESLLGGVDEATFNNVFAVGLRELQELGTLDDSAAGQLLYRLTTGLDRVSLVDVLHDLAASRQRLLASDGGDGQIIRLLERRQALKSQVDELRELTEQYSQLALAAERLGHDIRAAEQRQQAAEQEARVVEIAASITDEWHQRTALDRRLGELQDVAALPDDALNQLEQCQRQINQRGNQLRRTKSRRAKIKRQARSLRVNQALWNQATRIAALAGQHEWAGVLEKEVGQAGQEVRELEDQLSARRRRLGLDAEGVLPTAEQWTKRSVKSLKAPAQTVRMASDRYADARRRQQRAEQTAKQLEQQIRAALSDRAETDLTAALESAGNSVSRLRNVMQLDRRIEELSAHQQDLRETNRRLVEGQLLPGWVLVMLGGVFVSGVVLVLSGLLLPETITGSVGWLLAVLGLGGAAGTVAVKFSLERTAARRLQTNTRQLELAATQLEQACGERQALAAKLPQGVGPLSVRLQAAEAEMASLEELLELESRRQMAHKEATAAAEQFHAAEADRRQARKNWRRALVGLGLPDSLRPRQVRRLQSAGQALADLQRRLASRQAEYEARGKSLDALRENTDELAAAAGLSLEGESTADRMLALRRALDGQEVTVGERDRLRRRWQKHGRREMRLTRQLERAHYQRRKLLARWGVAGEQEVAHLAESCRELANVRRQRDEIDRRIEAAASGQCEPREVIELLSMVASTDLESRRTSLLDTCRGAGDELKRLYQQRGEYTERLAQWAADDRLPERQFDLDVVDCQLREAARRWLVLSVTGAVLLEVRTLYERERQPETLREASGYLHEMTSGHYVRIWTPLDEDVLYVDDETGACLPVELLSRGTREQIFLCLRLALAAAYARRGARLPLVLDDVLVNFDAERARAAARVLRNFAAAGHQLLLFTCHEHIMKLFKSLKVPVIRLPPNATAAVEETFDEKEPAVDEQKVEAGALEDESLEEEEEVAYEEDDEDDTDVIEDDAEDEYEEDEEAELEEPEDADEDDAVHRPSRSDRGDRFTWEDRTHLDETSTDDDRPQDAEAA